jgi:ribosome biogenesis protein NSA1
MAVTPSLLATTALDRFARVHSVYPPPELLGGQQDHRGSVLEKVFTKGIPTCIVWDSTPTICESAYDDIWQNMEDVSDESDMEGSVRRKHRRKS